MSQPFETWLVEALERNREGMDGCSVFVQIWREGIENEALPTLQLGLAVALDKPILLVISPGSRAALPENLRRLARDILELKVGDKESAAVAAEWMREKIEGLG